MKVKSVLNMGREITRKRQVKIIYVWETKRTNEQLIFNEKTVTRKTTILPGVKVVFEDKTMLKKKAHATYYNFEITLIKFLTFT